MKQLSYYMNGNKVSKTSLIKSFGKVEVDSMVSSLLHNYERGGCTSMSFYNGVVIVLEGK